MARYQIGARIPVDRLLAGDLLGELTVRDIIYLDATDYPDRYPGEDSVEVIVNTDGGYLRLSGYDATLTVPALHTIEIDTEPGTGDDSGTGTGYGPDRMRFHCHAPRRSRCRIVCATCERFGGVCACATGIVDGGHCQLVRQADTADPDTVSRAYDACTRPVLRPGPVLMYPTPAGRWLWRYPDTDTPATGPEVL